MTSDPWERPSSDTVRVLITTEGTYPFVVGGVSTWCDLLVTGLPNVHWELLAITASPEPLKPHFVLPRNVSWAGHIELWSESRLGRLPRCRRSYQRRKLPEALISLTSWDRPLEAVLEALVWCRTHPEDVDREFASEAAWDGFLAELRLVLEEEPSGAASPPALDLQSAVVLYQTLYWLARTAAAPTPEVDVCHVTAAGWSGVPAVVHKALFGTPVVLTEHGVYVREAYLAAIRNEPRAAVRFINTRLARGLARLTYRYSDVIAPVTGAHIAWEHHLGEVATPVLPIANGVPSPLGVTDTPNPNRIVSVGRLDPLKDVATLLRVASEVCRRNAAAEFHHYGPVPAEQERYAEACYQLHDELGLGDRFRFMGATNVPREVMRNAGVVLLTSISEGFPMAVLEAMSEARPVVATAVGGVSEAVEGSGLVAGPGRVHDLADAVLTLLDNPDLARRLGRRGHQRTSSQFRIETTLDRYANLFEELGNKSGVLV